MKEKKEQIIAQIETVNDMLNVICEELNELETIDNYEIELNDKILDLDKYNEFLKDYK